MATTNAGKTPKLLNQVRLKLRLKQSAWTTEKAYVCGVEKFLRFHKGRTAAGSTLPKWETAAVEEYLT